MNEVLSNAIDAIRRERDTEFDEAFAAVQHVADEYGEDDLAERIANEIPASVPWEIVADLLGMLIWSTRDNGTTILRQTEQWLLAGEDLRKIQIALNLDAYPFADPEQMRQVLQRVAERHSSIAAECEALVRQREAESPA
jgi:hypothetical protein